MYNVVIPDEAYFDGLILCQQRCPVHTKAGRYVQEIGMGDFESAFLIANEPNPFVYSCGRICAHPCEDGCRRGKIDAPVSICALKRAATDRHNVKLEMQKFPKERREERIAVVGAGPAGLSAARTLARLGYNVTIYEETDYEGGMLYLGIPVYRLPREIIKMEIDQIKNLGVEIVTNCRIGRDIGFNELFKMGYSAVFIGVGATRSREIKIEGIDNLGVLNGIDFLCAANTGKRIELGEKIIVIGGGNVAVDVARTAARGGFGNYEDGSTTVDAARWAVRLGAKEVRIVSLESRDELPAYEYEIDEAENEGVMLYPSRGPKRIVGENGRVTGLITVPCLRVFDESGRFNPQFMDEYEEFIPSDTIILAIGQKSDLTFIDKDSCIEISKRNTIVILPENYKTTREGVYAGGDVVFGPRILIDAIADGKNAAIKIHEYLSNSASMRKEKNSKWMEVINHKMAEGYDRIERVEMPKLQLSRRYPVAEVELGYSDEEARREALRCLNCQINTIFDGNRCILCGGCVDICPMYCLRLTSLSNVNIDNESFRNYVQEFKCKNGDATTIIKDEEMCIRCGLCAERCPVAAITMETFCEG